MRLELAAALVAPLLVAACAPQPQPVAAAPAEPRPPGPEYEAALHALIDCGLRQILRLDDGRSDAGLVARAAVARCAREKAGFEAVAMDRAATPRAAVPTAVEQATQSTFASIVLEVRAYRRARGGPPSGAANRRRLDEVAL